jgi:hypothetical protein
MVEPKKIALFAFRGEAPCVLHSLLNAEDMRKRGWEAIVILEGGSVKVFDKILNDELGISWERAKPLIDCACLGCSKLFNVDKMIEAAGVRLEGSMSNHVSIAKYMESGYQVIVM